MTEYERLLQSSREYNRVIHSITEYCRVLQSITKYYQEKSSASTWTNFWACFFLPGEKKHGEGGAEVGGGHVDPHVQGEGLDEGEEVWRGRRRLLVQDPNS